MGVLTEKTLLQDIKVSNINNTNKLNDLIEQVGEVQAIPTANTVLDRLKTIATNTSTNGEGSKTLIARSGVWADTQTIYTVPAGRTFYCLGISYANNGGATGVNGIRIGTNYKTICILTLSTGTAPNWISGGSGVLFTATSGQVLHHSSGNAQSQFVTIWGYELED